MEEDRSFLEADVRETIQSFSRGRVVSTEAAAKYDGFLSSPHGALVFQAGLLIAALSAYTFGPLFVSWSTMVRVPDSARFVTIEPPARATASGNDWYGVKLGYQPGTQVLYVTTVTNNTLADIFGVLPGDILARAWQDNLLIWPPESKDDFMISDEFIDFKWFIEKLPDHGEQFDLEEIDPTRPLSVTFDMTHVEVSNSKPPYFPISTTCVKCLLGSILFPLIAVAQKKENLQLIFNFQTARIMLIPSLGWAIAEVCEVLASSSMNPALYSVLQQSRILATAVFMRVLLGTKQTMMQSLILVSVSIVIFCYVQVPDYVGGGKFWNGFGDPQDVIEDEAEAREVKQSGISMGMIFAFLKVFLSVVMGVVGQKAMADPHIKKMSIITMQASIFVISAIPVLLLTLFLLWVTDWKHGFFGGVTVEFRHCGKDWPKNLCLTTVPVAHVAQGWDHRTLAVALFYGYRDLSVNAFLKIFDALIRTMVNASATLVTYFLSLALLGTRFNITKCGLIFGIMLQFLQYAIVPKYEEPPAVQADSNGVELPTSHGRS